jgi:hypothetical protein
MIVDTYARGYVESIVIFAYAANGIDDDTCIIYALHACFSWIDCVTLAPLRGGH